MVDLKEDCREALPRLPPLPESLALGESLTASFQPGQILDGASCILWSEEERLDMSNEHELHSE